ncbi:MAG: TRAP transporter substrate-binding protein [Polaromonas sp.]|uniref:TRAP transporter substrate-binding protein n=1 Tax=Polaromonas sp. TaxID=1869339 RepID=UPI002734E7A8|nr:TRAP transporter substrate-binding protein [Polaromonas sp.]MDP3798337.1 TRAP transporter substrate-binding protein [Polaromonas sp.]
MTMRSIFKALTTAAFCVVACASVAQAQDKWDSAAWIEGKPVTFKAGYNTVKQYPHGRAIERFANRVAERSGENLQIQTFPSEQAGNERQMLDSVILGNLDIAKVSTGVISTVVPEFGVFDLPYVFRDLNHMMATIRSKVGQDLAAKLEARNVKVLFWMEQGTRSFYTTSKQVRTPADLKGMKIRTIASPVMVDTINALGATATPMGFGDLYLGLKSGIVDGAENAPDAIWYAKHHEVAKYFSITNHFRTPVVVVMNKAKFDALPPEYKDIIMTTARDTEEWSGTLYSQVSVALLASLKKGGLTVVEADEAAFRKAVEPVYAKHGEKFAAHLKAIREIK